MAQNIVGFLKNLQKGDLVVVGTALGADATQTKDVLLLQILTLLSVDITLLDEIPNYQLVTRLCLINLL